MHIVAPVENYMGNKKKNIHHWRIKKKEIKTNTKKTLHQKKLHLPPTIQKKVLDHSLNT